jgi:hypothetical protein
MRISRNIYLGILFFTAACNNSSTPSVPAYAGDSIAIKGSYSYDAAFLKKNSSHVIELASGNAKVLLSGDYQGRVMSSTASGDSGTSYGWINYNLLSVHQKKKQFNPVGGEERLWFGPEGGQYSIYFSKRDSFTVAHWQVPAVVDTEAYTIAQADSLSATFTKSAMLTNYSGTTFNFDITRKVTLFDSKSASQKLHVDIPNGIQYVGYESSNSIKNTGTATWKKETGLLSIWLLGMMTPTEQTRVIIPFSPGQNSRSLITDNYFGKIPGDRLLVKDSVLFFRCDGRSRGKLGISPAIAKPIVASFDFKKNVLTILVPEVHKGAMYVNSKWEIQKQPYLGDVINSYNDGPLQDGTQLGPFYEIESSSPAAELKPGETEEYHQSTFHLQGSYEQLKQLAKQILQVDLDEVKNW